MIVAIDGFEWRDQPTGVGRFMKNLLSLLIPAAPQDRFFLFVPSPLQSPPAWPNLELVIREFRGGYFRWQNTVLPGLIARHGCDRLLAPNNLPPLFPGVPSLVVVHDISWRSTPGDFSLKQRVSHDLRARWGLRKAAVLTAVSDFSAGEIERWYGVPRRRIQVIHHGLQPGLQRSSEAEITAFRTRYGLQGKKAIGFLGALFGRRHITELIEATDRLRKRIDAFLLLAGPDRLGPASGIDLNRDWIVRIPWLAEEEIAAFYSSLDLHVYLSKYEGFGLPPMEALQCGTVPLLLTGSSLTELYSGCALFADSPDPEQITPLMEAFLKDPEEKDALLERWKQREQTFSWSTAARSYLTLLRGICR